MSRRNKLKGIAIDLIHSLSTRNNDFLGYWATGQLYKFACEVQVDIIVIDVLNRTIKPDNKAFYPLCQNYKSLFIRHLKTRGLPFEILKGITIEYEFNQEHNPRIHRSIGVGKPYIIRLIINTELKQNIILEAGGYCRKHEPSREQKSLRAKASNN